MKLLTAVFFIVLLLCVFSPVVAAYEYDSEYLSEENGNTYSETMPQPDDQIDSDLEQADFGVQAYGIMEAQSQAINRFTGLPVDPSIALNRPVAAVFNNARAALPQHGISRADIIYEMLVEGGMTRMLALFLDVTNIGNIGSIRSMRPYMHYIGYSYRAIYVHAGGSPEAMQILNWPTIDRLDGVFGPGAGAFFRVSGRIHEHALFTSGANINAGIRSLGIRREHPYWWRERLFFSDDATPQYGRPATGVNVRFSSSNTTRFSYDSENNVYHVTLHNNIPYVDGNNNSRVAVSNILVLRMETRTIDYVGRLHIQTVGGGRGYFIHGGRAVEINWQRGEVRYQFEYYFRNADGSNGPELVLGRGKTYICIVPLNAQVSFFGPDFALRPPAGFTNIRVFLDGIEFPTTYSNGQFIVAPVVTTKRTAVMYSFDEDGLPNGMFCWRLTFANGTYTATPIPGLQDLITYIGYSIRITGNSGIRAHNSIAVNTRNRLLTTGIDGFTLQEYGTLVMDSRDIADFPLVLGGERTGRGVSFVRDGIDVAFRVQDGQIMFTSVLVGIPPEEYMTEFLFRGYAVLRRGGRDYVFYGPAVGRSIYHVANQVYESGQFPEGSQAHLFIRNIIENAG